MFYFLSFFLLSLFSYRWLSLSPSPAPVRNFPSSNIFPQSRTDDYIATYINAIGWCHATENLSPPTLFPIQGVPGGKVNILGGHSIGHSKQKCLYEHVSYSEQFPR